MVKEDQIISNHRKWESLTMKTTVFLCFPSSTPIPKRPLHHAGCLLYNTHIHCFSSDRIQVWWRLAKHHSKSGALNNTQNHGANGCKFDCMVGNLIFKCMYIVYIHIYVDNHINHLTTQSRETSFKQITMFS